MKPIYTIYESMRKPNGDWTLGTPCGVTHWTSKRKVEKVIRAHYESMVEQKEGTEIEFHKRRWIDGASYFEFNHNGNRYRRWIVQEFLV